VSFTDTHLTAFVKLTLVTLVTRHIACPDSWALTVEVTEVEASGRPSLTEWNEAGPMSLVALLHDECPIGSSHSRAWHFLRALQTVCHCISRAFKASHLL